MTRNLSIIGVIGIVLSFSFTGCSNDTMSSSGGRLKLSIKAMAGSLPKSASPQAQQVTITSAKVVLSKIELESSNKDSMDFMSGIPLVVSLNLTGAMTPLNTVSVPFGTYEELELEISKLDSTDGQVYTANPDLQNLSVSVKGYVDGDTTAVFLFTSALYAEQEQEISPPLVVDANTPNANIVLTIDTTTWFSDKNGGVLDPRDPQNQTAIERNIKASVNMFEDDDDDGEPDDDDDGIDDDDDDDDDGDSDDGDDDGGDDDDGTDD
ncbi:MAG: hypothetical protein L0287_12385 [Anaerolineae bacterium]|nr:hypothetical protein [Anaerolineae bacterium]